MAERYVYVKAAANGDLTFGFILRCICVHLFCIQSETTDTNLLKNFTILLLLT